MQINDNNKVVFFFLYFHLSVYMPNIETTMASSTTKTEKPKLILPWKTKLAMSIASALTDAATHSDGTINRRLLNFLDRRIPPKPAPINGVYTRDVSVDAANNVWFRVYTPTAATSATATVSLPVIIFFHGGGFAFLSPASPNYDAVCRRFCRKIQVVVVSVNYRLCPEHRYPTQYDDGFSAVKFIDENRASLPEIADVSKCFIAGDSAGANIAHHVAIRVCQSELQQLQVIGLISIQPYFGGEERTESELRLTNAPLVSVARTDWLWKVLLPDGSDRDHPASNVSGPNAIDLSGIDYPDTLVFVGGFDPLQDWQRRYYEWLKKSGKKAEIIEYPNMIHAFYVFPNLPEATQLISQVKDFIMKRVSN